MIEIVTQLIELVGSASPVLYIFAGGWALGKIVWPLTFLGVFIYLIYSVKSCCWWMVRDEVVKRIRKKKIVVDGPGGDVDEEKP